VITEVTQVGGELAANVTVTSPGPSCVVTLAITSPVQVVSIARSDMAVRFQTKQEIRNCS
jgi:protease stability complex PrcB-like protein